MMSHCQKLGIGKTGHLFDKLMNVRGSAVHSERVSLVVVKYFSPKEKSNYFSIGHLHAVLTGLTSYLGSCLSPVPSPTAPWPYFAVLIECGAALYFHLSP